MKFISGVVSTGLTGLAKPVNFNKKVLEPINIVSSAVSIMDSESFQTISKALKTKLKPFDL